MFLQVLGSPVSKTAREIRRLPLPLAFLEPRVAGGARSWRRDVGGRMSRPESRARQYRKSDVVKKSGDAVAGRGDFIFLIEKKWGGFFAFNFGGWVFSGCHEKKRYQVLGGGYQRIGNVWSFWGFLPPKISAFFGLVVHRLTQTWAVGLFQQKMGGWLFLWPRTSRIQGHVFFLFFKHPTGKW